MHGTRRARRVAAELRRLGASDTEHVDARSSGRTAQRQCSPIGDNDRQMEGTDGRSATCLGTLGPALDVAQRGPEEKMAGHFEKLRHLA